jgi:hypothetical protein
MAYVVVNSTWQFAEHESVKESIDGKPVVVKETTSTTSTPTGGSNAASANTNIASEFGATNAAIPPVTTPSATESVATTKESSKNSVVGKETRLERTMRPSWNGSRCRCSSTRARRSASRTSSRASRRRSASTTSATASARS